ncbi:MAG: RNA 2',3'-cyclic phosphodiesterase [Candidatus Aminicenantes bacterium]|nr:RNA 2',3'-cyclic phosphodiesterase [Candidatus Aminicenantes bacterium]
MPDRPGLDPKAPDVIRAFIAIDVPPEVKNHLGSVSAALGALDLDARPSPVSSIHLTLRFLGNVEESRVPGIGDAIRRCAQRVPPFPLEVRNLGAFPSRKRPRIVWAGVAGDGGLERLHRFLELELQELGFDRERKKFRPHLTLLRLKSSRNLKRLSNYLETEARGTGPVSFLVRRIHLYESRLSSRGARHEKLVTAELAG